VPVRRLLPRLPLPRLFGWPRRAAALACLLLAVTSFLGQRAGAAHAKRNAVLVATRNLAAGAVLTAGDVAAQPWPGSQVPGTALHDARDVVGRHVAGPMVSGEVVTANRLVGSELARNLGDGQVAVAVTVAAEMTSFVRPGDQVDVVAAGTQTAAADVPKSSPTRDAGSGLADHVRVLAVLSASQSIGGEATATLVVAAPRPIAAVLAQGDGARMGVLLSG
jgi:pilus assembly protein CpaB